MVQQDRPQLPYAAQKYDSSTCISMQVIIFMEEKMTKLFETTELNGMTLQNRFVRSATYEAMAGLDGTVTEQLYDYMDQLSRGDVGLIIFGHTHVTREGQAETRPRRNVSLVIRVLQPSGWMKLYTVSLKKRRKSKTTPCDWR